MGLIAGGLADGSVCLWDPAAILAGQAHPLARMQKHTGAVSVLPHQRKTILLDLLIPRRLSSGNEREWKESEATVPFLKASTTHTDTHTHTHTHTYTHIQHKHSTHTTYTHKYAHTRTHTHADRHTNKLTHHTHTHTHTHTYTYAHNTHR